MEVGIVVNLDGLSVWVQEVSGVVVVKLGIRNYIEGVVGDERIELVQILLGVFWNSNCVQDLVGVVKDGEDVSVFVVQSDEFVVQGGVIGVEVFGVEGKFEGELVGVGVNCCDLMFVEQQGVEQGGVVGDFVVGEGLLQGKGGKLGQGVFVWSGGILGCVGGQGEIQKQQILVYGNFGRKQVGKRF